MISRRLRRVDHYLIGRSGISYGSGSDIVHWDDLTINMLHVPNYMFLEEACWLPLKCIFSNILLLENLLRSSALLPNEQQPAAD